MNLHILPDSKFSEAFYNNMVEAGLTGNNKFVIRTRAKKLVHVKELPFAPLYSLAFSRYVGDVSSYERVFIHQLSPLMYRWIATHSFKELNWISWGTDLYTLPFVKAEFLEPETRPLVRRAFNGSMFLYLLKVYLTNMPFKRKAYAKVSNMLTWMRSEFEFARTQIPPLKASHLDFFYENQMPYEKIDAIVATAEYDPQKRLRLIIGNSGTPTNNHLDAIRKIDNSGIEADLHIPVSYGDPAYIAALKRSTGFYKAGKIHFIDKLMPFEEYVRFLYSADALVMHHIRPQGYGNIFMMMYMNKPVLLNAKNISLQDLQRAELKWLTLEQLQESSTKREVENKEKIVKFLAHERLLTLYRALFK
ncbi:MAG TPA: TDP-N-acetylfucosamine:lipid II N-acetylfucosaminyltransferase [Chryseosolibacter sp.]